MINTDGGEEMGKISNGKGSLGHCHLLQLQQTVIELGLLSVIVQSVSSF